MTTTTTILHAIRNSAARAISRGESTVTLATQQAKTPTVSRTKLCQSCGPIGTVQQIVYGVGGMAVIVARYDAKAVIRFCGRELLVSERGK